MRRLVGNFDDYSIPLLSVNDRARILIIDGHNFFTVAQFFDGHCMNLIAINSQTEANEQEIHIPRAKTHNSKNKKQIGEYIYETLKS